MRHPFYIHTILANLYVQHMRIYKYICIILCGKWLITSTFYVLTVLLLLLLFSFPVLGLISQFNTSCCIFDVIWLICTWHTNTYTCTSNGDLMIRIEKFLEKKKATNSCIYCTESFISCIYLWLTILKCYKNSEPYFWKSIVCVWLSLISMWIFLLVLLFEIRFISKFDVYT